MQHVSAIANVRALQPFLQEPTFGGLRRKTLYAPFENGLFVKPLKQCFFRNPRLMPMTRIVLQLLAGWGGDGTPIKTTLGSIAKHVSRSTRQVQRYLKDAIEEGYLALSYTKDRIGRITGLRIYLNRLALHPPKPRTLEQQTRQNPPQAAEKLATTFESAIKGKIYIDSREEGRRKREQTFGSIPIPDAVYADMEQKLSEGGNPFRLVREHLLSQKR